ncbi:hypothetical protein KXQ82_19710 [Mucilaginibacter sp. HMF5004]|uniref:hypothetical protein n=1 Tax=Mucilaginibacter rivuli TaxID=2857527 RepID=UPI001C5D712E|nr:hypothetical protein [Mucilaginibacter rivuli]MBW4891961.1 hypothetical protein [Mucilaginibacter rivuli]
MEKFPELNTWHVALLRAEFKSGVVLDEQFKPVTDNKQKIYTKFTQADEAFAVAKQLILQNPDTECIIYGHDEEVLYYLTPQNITHINQTV